MSKKDSDSEDISDNSDNMWLLFGSNNGTGTGRSATYTVNFGASSFSDTPTTDFTGIYQDAYSSTDQFISAFSWIKNRDATDNHMLFDRVRGITKDFHSNTDVVEVTNVNTLQRFLAGGVQVGDDVEVNTASESYVLWNWMMEATGSGSANEDGTINTTATLVDTTLGMSISTWTGASVTSTGTTIGHGLGVSPSVIIIKNLSYATAPAVYHSGSFVDASDPGILYLSGTAARSADTNVLGTSGAVTSSTFTVGDWRGSNYASELFVAYCFAPSQFISIGKYTGNGNTDGIFVPLLNSADVPIQPRWVMIKRTDGAGENWGILDVKRDIYNASDNYIAPNSTAAETGVGANDAFRCDLVSGGIKFRTTGYSSNKASSTYVYLAIGTPMIDTDGRIIGGG